MSFPLYIVLATAGRDLVLPEALASLSDCVKPPDFKGLIVVENGAKNDVEGIVSAEEFSTLQIKYLYSPLPSKSNALNVALQSLGKEDALIFFTDDDVLFREDVLASYSLAGAKYGPGHFFGGSLERTPDSAIPDEWKVPLLPLSALGWDPRENAMSTFFFGCNWAAFRSDLDSLMGFDVQFGPGSIYGAVGQETDMQTRLMRSGCVSVYVEDAVVAHRVSSESMSIRWILNRHLKMGVYRGLTTIDCSIRYDRSCAGNEKMNVIDSAVKLSGTNKFKFAIFNLLVKSARYVGALKGAVARRRA